MKFLLDSHVFIWLFAAPEKLGEKARSIIEAQDSELLLSAASIWELGVKHQLGKLSLPLPIEEYITSRAQDAGIGLLPISPIHCFRVTELPFHHKDPFDRMIVAQALTENLTVLTHDSILSEYNILIQWA
jgi:PIN domain nuclease of toxin-antitoxin system